MNKILLTGGAGYIGSHILVELLQSNFTVLVVDILDSSSTNTDWKPESVLRAEKLGKNICKYVQLNLQDLEKVSLLFKTEGPFDCVIHCAGIKGAGKSCQAPINYFASNVVGSFNLIKVMNDFGLKRIVFSSLVTVYGNASYLPVDEAHPTGGSACTTPYGNTKYTIEQLLRGICTADQEWKAVALRYLNVIGAHPSGTLGENPLGPPNNLVPFVAQVAAGHRPVLEIYGNDYDTPDGTGAQEYIHVADVARANLMAVKRLIRLESSNVFSNKSELEGWNVYNIGSGKSASVLEILAAFEKACGQTIPYKIVPRRDGDVSVFFTSSAKALEELNWKAEKSIVEMCADAWNWQSQNPKGYEILNNNI